jgi:hypothetical protein
MKPGDLVEAIEGLKGEHAIITNIEQELQVKNGAVIYFNWATVSWNGTDAITTMPLTYFKLIRTAQEA